MGGSGAIEYLGALRCVGCGAGGLQRVGDFLACPVCGRTYPVRADVPVMIADASVLRGPLMDPAAVDATLQAIGLPAEPVEALRVRRASGARVQFAGSPAEAGCGPFLQRVREAGYIVLDADAPAADKAEPADGDDDEIAPQIRWHGDHIPRALAPGQGVLANVRFENVGAVTMRHAGHGRITVTSEWRNEHGEAVPAEDRRTAMPHDLLPGQAVTMPVALRAPSGAGVHRLVLKMVQEDVRWLQPDYGPLRIHLRPSAAFTVPPHWGNPDPEATEAPPDPVASLDRLRDWLAPAGPAPQLLELGGLLRPLVARWTSGAFVVDLDLLAAQVGSIAARSWAGPVQYICADPARLPFPPGFFDAAVIFAALRYCPDPVAALRGLAAHLRPGGFIGLFCEPFGPARPTPERAAGPRYSLAEYAAIIRDAGLQAADVAFEGGALSARLTPIP